MRNFYNTLAVITIIFFALTSSFAQNGQYDVRFNIQPVDCATSQVLVDIDVRATGPGHTFNISDQNYRFSYNREAVAVGSAAIHQEHLTGFVAPSSFYQPHTLTGSLDTIVSYNLVLAGGEGKLVTTDWLTVGTISFTVIDASKCLDLIWHDHAPENFPPTFIGEKETGTLYATTEANYYNSSACFNQCLAPSLPIELLYFSADENECAIDLEWATATEINNSHFWIQKSTDGIEFNTIATIEGSGNSTSPRYYHHRDENQGLETYYRLVQIDFDGTATTFDVIVAKSNCVANDLEDSIMGIYPNPVRGGNVTLEFYSSSARPNATIIVTDVLGRMVDNYQAEFQTGENTFSFSADNLANGSYFVQIIDGSWSAPAQKIIKVQ